MKTKEDLEALVRGLGARVMRAIHARDKVIGEDSIIARDIVRFVLDVPADITPEGVLHEELQKALDEGRAMTTDPYQALRDRRKHAGQN